MRSIPDQAETLILTILLQDAQMRSAGVPATLRAHAIQPGVEGLLQQFQDELLAAQREAGAALAAALNRVGGV